jgi:recombination protein RecA
MSSTAHRISDLVSSKHLRFGDALGRPVSAGWNREGMAGRLVELRDAHASASLTAALGLVLNAQGSGETAVWVTSKESCFFPPDAAEGGVDLDALTLVRVPRDRLIGAAEKLVRSGAFGLVVIDMNGGGRGKRGLGRLLGLAREHDTAVVFLTGKRFPDSSLGSLISLRGEARRIQVGPDQHQVEVCISKDNRRAPGWVDSEVCCGPAGLR